MTLHTSNAITTRVHTTELSAHIGERVRIEGWLHALRRLGGVSFVVVRDGWGLAQAVVGEAALAALEGVGVESVIAVEGMAVVEAQAPGGVELREPTVDVLVPVTEPPPLSLNKRDLKATLSTQLDNGVLAARHPKQRSMFRMSAGVMRAYREILTAEGFTEVQTPKLVASATESGANVFKLDYFGRPAYLAQSPQLYKQVLTGVFERVFEVGPVFRAEPHDTTRHLSEYVSLDMEMAFIQDHRTVMGVLTKVIRGILAALAERHAEDLARWEVTMPSAPAEFPSIYFPDAQQLIYERHGVDVRGEPDLSPQDERWLGEWARETYGSDFLFVTGYPMSKRPFYTHPNPADPRYSNSFDLLFRGTELVTGGQRLHLYEDYLAALERARLSPAPFEWYLEAFKYGMAPHGGFAIGLERLLTQLTGVGNVRLATLFPRDLHRLTP
ncbi:MAG: aspartate--tRNA(Asn) ligase [Anaerolineae bacterium]